MFELIAVTLEAKPVDILKDDCENPMLTNQCLYEYSFTTINFCSSSVLDPTTY